MEKYIINVDSEEIPAMGELQNIELGDTNRLARSKRNFINIHSWPMKDELKSRENSEAKSGYKKSNMRMLNTKD